MLAKKSDIKQLCQLRYLQQKDDWTDEFDDSFDLIEQTRKYLKIHLNKDLFIFVYKNENEIVATCGIQIIDYLPQCIGDGKKGYICNVYTKNEYRNKGIQTRLLEKCIEFAKQKNVFELQLSTDNPIAIKLYKKMGFVNDELMMKLKI